MNPSTANPPVFDQTNLSYSVQSPYVSQKVYESYSSHFALDSLALRTQPIDVQVTTGQGSISHLFNPHPALNINEPHNTESFSDTQTMPAITMGPPTKSRKRKAPTLRADAWEPYKARIVELHITQGIPLREVKEKIKEEFGFTAQYVSLFILSKVDL